MMAFVLGSCDSIHFNSCVQDDQVRYCTTYWDDMFCHSCSMDEFSTLTAVCHMLVFAACQQMILQQIDI